VTKQASSWLGVTGNGPKADATMVVDVQVPSEPDCYLRGVLAYSLDSSTSDSSAEELRSSSIVSSSTFSTSSIPRQNSVSSQAAALLLAYDLHARVQAQVSSLWPELSLVYLRAQS
jgi:hypothetical protein